MTKHDKGIQQSRASGAKKPYVKPGFQREKVFETMALTCGKVQSTEHGCHSSRKVS